MGGAWALVVFLAACAQRLVRGGCRACATACEVLQQLVACAQRYARGVCAAVCVCVCVCGPTASVQAGGGGPVHGRWRVQKGLCRKGCATARGACATGCGGGGGGVCATRWGGGACATGCGDGGGPCAQRVVRGGGGWPCAQRVVRGGGGRGVRNALCAGEGPGHLESEGEEGAVWDVVTWDPVELEGEGDHMEGVGVGSEQPQL